MLKTNLFITQLLIDIKNKYPNMSVTLGVDTGTPIKYRLEFKGITLYIHNGTYTLISDHNALTIDDLISNTQYMLDLYTFIKNNSQFNNLKSVPYNISLLCSEIEL